MSVLWLQAKQRAGIAKVARAARRQPPVGEPDVRAPEALTPPCSGPLHSLRSLISKPYISSCAVLLMFAFLRPVAAPLPETLSLAGASAVHVSVPLLFLSMDFTNWTRLV